MASERDVLEGIQSVVQGVTDYFIPESVVINDWSIKDRPVSEGPFFNIITASTFRNRQQGMVEQAYWDIMTELIVPFVDWKESMTLFRDARQAILDKFNEVGTNRSAGISEGFSIDEIRSGGPVTYVTLNYTDPANRQDELPQYLSQFIIFAGGPTF